MQLKESDPKAANGLGDLEDEDAERLKDSQGRYSEEPLWGGPFLSCIDCLVYSIVEAQPANIVDMRQFADERMKFWEGSEGQRVFADIFPSLGLDKMQLEGGDGGDDEEGQTENDL